MMSGLLNQIDEAIEIAVKGSQKKMVARLESIRNYVQGYNDALWGFKLEASNDEN